MKFPCNLWEKTTEKVEGMGANKDPPYVVHVTESLQNCCATKKVTIFQAQYFGLKLLITKTP